MTKRKFLTLLIIVTLFLVLSFLFITKKTTTKPADKATPSTNTKTTSPTQQSFDKTKYSITDPASLWILVNKSRPLNSPQYTPNDLIVPAVQLRLNSTAEQMQIRQVVHQPLKELFVAGKVAGFDFAFGSGYRSYALQKQFYEEYVRTIGEAEANRTSARPGTSEHQTGLSFDIEATGQKCHLDKCMADLPDGKWLAEHAHEYGFIIRYPLGKEAVTGYDFEPWHLRYVGKDLANQLHSTNKTMEEFFGVN